jgi:hypothetical protein
MGAPDKAREDRLRRMARRHGLKLEKCRRRNRSAPDYGTYRLAARGDGGGEAGDGRSPYGLSLDDVQAALARRESRTRSAVTGRALTARKRFIEDHLALPDGTWVRWSEATAEQLAEREAWRRRRFGAAVRQEA